MKTSHPVFRGARCGQVRRAPGCRAAQAVIRRIRFAAARGGAMEFVAREDARRRGG